MSTGILRVPTVTSSDGSNTNDGTLRKATDSTWTTSPRYDTRASASTRPAGVSKRRCTVGGLPSCPDQIKPRSMAMVLTAMMPWPHIVLHPSLCMNRMPA